LLRSVNACVGTVDTFRAANEERELIGIEFLSPELVTPEAVNRALAEHGFDPIDAGS
jgi:hypothetical protein